MEGDIISNMSISEHWTHTVMLVVGVFKNVGIIDSNHFKNESVC